MKPSKWILGLAALEICGVGLVYLVAPRVMMESNGLTLTGVNDAHLVRSAYGGLFVAFGSLFAAGAVSARLTRHALVALAVFMGGFAVGRIASLLADGWPPGAFLFALATEIAFCALALWALSRPAAGAA